MPFERPDIIRPPSERMSYFLPLTSGCSNATCSFCMYYGSKLRMRDVDEVKTEIDALSVYVKSGMRMPSIPEIAYQIAGQWDRKGIFLQDGDALVYPYPKLVEALEHLNERLPFVQRIATYATAQDVLRRTPAELTELRRLKLGIVYLGLESGDDEILKGIAKGVETEGMIEAARRAKAAGILTSVTVILGLAGVEGSERHALETARVLSEMDPDYVGALTTTFVPGTPLHRDMTDGKFTPVSAFHSLRELIMMIENSHLTRCFFSSVHASNYFTIRGTLPEDRERMLAELKTVVDEGDPSSLRPEFLRGL
ncbi:MAG: hypothetical protein A2147_11570 [Chloroflexi bacterium RBG_16_57_8]|nr:MAG: hypothetical protein A2147_11570 [Chloroflexi bacterium RBG_16_57_8]